MDHLDRAVPGRCEGGLIIGLWCWAIGRWSNAPRDSRCWSTRPAPRAMESPRMKTGPALDGYGAIAMTIALAATMTDVREQLRRTWTVDRGKAFSAHGVFRVQTSIPVHFAEPISPGSEGRSRTPTDCLVRQHAPKRSRPLAMDRRGAPGRRRRALEHRPRKSLSWGTPRKPSTRTYGHSNDPVWQRVALPS